MQGLVFFLLSLILSHPAYADLNTRELGPFELDRSVELNLPQGEAQVFRIQSFGNMELSLHLKAKSGRFPLVRLEGPLQKQPDNAPSLNQIENNLGDQFIQLSQPG